MKITELLQGIGSPIAFYPDLVPIAGSHQATIFLCQLTYWHGKQFDQSGWIYKTQEEWFLETELSPKEQKTARELLVDRKLIEERYVGIPCRLEYRLKEEEFNTIWDTWLIAAKIKHEFKELNHNYGFLDSRGVAAEDIKLNLRNYRYSYRKCQMTIKHFFEECKATSESVLERLGNLEEMLQAIAQTLEKSRISQWEIQENTTRRSKHTALRDPGIPHSEIQAYRSKGSKDRPKSDRHPSQTKSPQDVEQASKTTPEITQKVGAEIPAVTQELQDDWARNIEEKVRCCEPITRQELLELGEYRLGDVVRLYRHSGRFLDPSPEDFKDEFIQFVRNYSFAGTSDLSFIVSTVKKYERDPQHWDLLKLWIDAWAKFRQVEDSCVQVSPVPSAEKIPPEQWLEIQNRISQISTNFRVGGKHQLENHEYQ